MTATRSKALASQQLEPASIEIRRIRNDDPTLDARMDLGRHLVRGRCVVEHGAGDAREILRGRIPKIFGPTGPRPDEGPVLLTEGGHAVVSRTWWQFEGGVISG